MSARHSKCMQLELADEVAFLGTINLGALESTGD